MSYDTTSREKIKSIIDEVQVTEDTLSSRGGLPVSFRLHAQQPWP